MIVQVLSVRIDSVAPIFGVAIGLKTDKSTWRIDFKPEATAAQRQAAQNILDTFNVAAEEKKLTDAETSKKDKRTVLLTTPNKSIIVQDLIDLGLL